MHVYEASGGEFCGAIGEGGIECALVMVVAVGRRGVLPTHVNYCVACREEGRVSGANEGGGLIGRKETEEIDC